MVQVGVEQVGAEQVAVERRAAERQVAAEQARLPQAPRVSQVLFELSAKNHSKESRSHSLLEGTILQAPSAPEAQKEFSLIEDPQPSLLGLDLSASQTAIE